jgi:competence protein ComEA
LVAPASAQAADGSAPAASVEANHARRADLERLPGIGVDLADAVLRERERRPFEDWADLIARVPGLGPRRAARLSRAGLRVQGLAYGLPAATAD